MDLCFRPSKGENPSVPPGIVQGGSGHKHLLTKDDLDEALAVVNKAFQGLEERMDGHEGRMTQKLDRLERIISAWPAPSAITALLGRVSRLEREHQVIKKKLKMTH